MLHATSRVRQEGCGGGTTAPEAATGGQRLIKLGGQWRLCHGWSDDTGRDVEWKPLRDTAVDQRLNAIEFLDGLCQAIIEEKESLVLRVEGTIAKAAIKLNDWQLDSNNPQF